jgi:hypothetical protein
MMRVVEVREAGNGIERRGVTSEFHAETRSVGDLGTQQQVAGQAKGLWKAL